jgi:hypothetical protein
MSDLETIAQIDKRILDLETELGHLKGRRNALVAPIYRLPTDIIVHFIKHAQGAYRYRDRSSHVSSSPAWMNFVNSCSYFRRIALGHADVWSVIDVCWPLAWIDACTARAKSTPLIVSYAPGYKEERYMTSSLKLHVFAQRFFPSACAIRIDHDLLNEDREDLQVILPQPPRAHTQSTLTADEIGRGSVPRPVLEPDACRFPRLCHLNIGSYTVEGSSCIVLLQQIISHAPKLQTLIISFVREYHSVFACSLPTLFLADLATVDLSGNITAVAAVLRFLPDPKIHLKVELSPPPEFEEPLGQTWQPESAQQTVLNRVLAFWRIRADASETLSGTLQVSAKQYPVLELTGAASDRVRSTACYVVYSSSYLVIAGPTDEAYEHPLTAHVTTVYWSARVTDNAVFRRLHTSRCFFPRLRRVIIEGAGPYMDLLTGWVREQHRILPLENVSFRECHDSAYTCFETLRQDLGEDRMTWEYAE